MMLKRKCCLIYEILRLLKLFFLIVMFRDMNEESLNINNNYMNLSILSFIDRLLIITYNMLQI